MQDVYRRKSHDSRQGAVKMLFNRAVFQIARPFILPNCPKNTAGLHQCPGNPKAGFSVTIACPLSAYACPKPDIPQTTHLIRSLSAPMRPHQILFRFRNRICSDLSLSMDQSARRPPHRPPCVVTRLSRRRRVGVTLAVLRWRVAGAWVVRHGGNYSENARKSAACHGVNLRPVTLPVAPGRLDALCAH